MLSVNDLHVKFHTRNREAVGGISFRVDDGEILGLVGESGSGKTVTAMSICGLLDRDICDARGSVMLDGVDVLSASQEKMMSIKGKDIGVVFQDPMSAMDPLMKIGPQVEEVLKIHTKLTGEERRQRALKALSMADLDDPDTVYGKYPFELSGGMLQRVMIAAALVIKPRLMVLDEPTTALDVTTQNDILKLLTRLNKKSGISMLFISHNLNVVRKLCPRVIVMQRGLIVENGDTETVFRSPSHPYTKKLIDSIPFWKRGDEDA